VTAFDVWAPNASKVDVVVDDVAHPMARRGGSWWHADVETVDADTANGGRYGFRLDDGDTLPDPRSPWQPDGVHGLSRLVDHTAFPWRCEHWPTRPLTGSVVYELHIGTFTPAGTFDAAIERLDHLRELGVDYVEILPVAAFPGRHGWGYDGVFPYAVQHSYGGPDGLKRFVDACHERGLATVLDVVYNHFGPDGNVLAAYGPYFTDAYATPWGQAINFSGPDSDEVRRYFVENALMWLRDYRFDALRLDAVHAIVDTSATHLLEELADAVAAQSRALGRPAALVAESDLNDPRIVSPRRIGGFAVDAQWSDDFHHAVHAALTGENFGYYEDFGGLQPVATALRQGFVYTGQHSSHRRRRHGRPLPDAVESHQLLGYAQDHDQVGNRARGERLSMLVSPRLQKVAAALVLTSPFTPMLFMGEEWGATTPWQYFTDHQDPQLAEAVRTGRRNEFRSFGWDPEQVPDPQDPATVERSTLDWTQLSRPPHAELLRWYRDLIALRRATPDLRDDGFPDVSVDVDDDTGVLVLTRGSTTVVANIAGEPREVKVDAEAVLLSSDAVVLASGVLRMPAESVAIVGSTAQRAASG
jgi:maltooligosyltrehalose trehalohydrolase